MTVSTVLPESAVTQARQRNSEEALHREVVVFLNTCLYHPPLAPVWFHPHNEGFRSKAEAGVAKALGQRPGISDLVFLWSGQDRRPFLIELKAPKGKLSSHQREVLEWGGRVGVGGYIARSLEQVVAALDTEGVPLRCRTT